MSTAQTALARLMTAPEWAELILLSALWGGSFFFIGVAVRALPPLTIVLCRVALAALTLALVLRWIGQRWPRDRTIWLSFLVMGVLNNVIPFGLIVWAQQTLPSGLASILNAMTPIFSVLVGVLIAGERPGLGRVLGVILGFAGVAVLLGSAALSSGKTPLLPQLACLGAAISYALAGLYGRRFRVRGVPPLLTAAGQVTLSSLVLLPVVLLIEAPWRVAIPAWPALAALVALAVLSTAFAYLLYFRLLGSAGPTNVLLVTLLVPVTAILLGAAVLGERLAGHHGAGMALIALGLAAIDGRPLGWLRRSA